MLVSLFFFLSLTMHCPFLLPNDHMCSFCSFISHLFVMISASGLLLTAYLLHAGPSQMLSTLLSFENPSEGLCQSTWHLPSYPRSKAAEDSSCWVSLTYTIQGSGALSFTFCQHWAKRIKLEALDQSRCAGYKPEWKKKKETQHQTMHRTTVLLFKQTSHRVVFGNPMAEMTDLTGLRSFSLQSS